MSTLEVNNIKDTGSNSLISSDGSGTFTINNSVLKNTPAFHAYPSTDTSIASSTSVKVPANTEVFDTDSCYDNSTNYRFTPTVAGKYFCYISFTYNLINGNIGLVGELRKNGSAVLSSKIEDSNQSNANYKTSMCSGMIEFNGSSDYLEFYTATTSGLTRTLATDSQRTFFGAYRLIGA